MSKSASGIVKKSDGSEIIPATRRADGSLRKEVKVRPVGNSPNPSYDNPSYDNPSYDSPNPNILYQ